MKVLREPFNKSILGGTTISRLNRKLQLHLLHQNFVVPMQKFFPFEKGGLSAILTFVFDEQKNNTRT
jgi:hypothetical protein